MMRISSCAGLALSCLLCQVALVVCQTTETEVEAVTGLTTPRPPFQLSLVAINRDTNLMEFEFEFDTRLGNTTSLSVTGSEVDNDDDDTKIHSGELADDVGDDGRGIYILEHLQSTAKYKVCVTRTFNPDPEVEMPEGFAKDGAVDEASETEEVCETYETIGIMHTKELIVMICVLGYFALCIILGWWCYSSKKAELEAAAAEEEAEDEEKEPIAEPEMVAAAPVAMANSAPPPRPAKSPIEADVPFATPPYADLSEEDKLRQKDPDAEDKFPSTLDIYFFKYGRLGEGESLPILNSTY